MTISPKEVLTSENDRLAPARTCSGLDCSYDEGPLGGSDSACNDVTINTYRPGETVGGVVRCCWENYREFAVLFPALKAFREDCNLF